MAFTIRIYETDSYIYSLLKRRLGEFYPDAYIVNPYLEDQDSENMFSEFERVIYDPSNMKEEDISHMAASALRLTDDGGIIDCSRLIQLLLPSEDAPVINQPTTGTHTAVIPFVYSDVRDRFVSDLENDLTGADFNIRLDFTTRLRALWNRSSCSNMTALLQDCRSRRFVPEDILKYCNMDDSGFLTPGSCRNNDDVYDLGIERSLTLIHLASDLAHSKVRFVNVVSIIEGFKTKDLPDLLSSCDRVYILLPARNAGEDIGAKELISVLTKVLGKECVFICYAEDLIMKGSADNPLTERGMAV